MISSHILEEITKRLVNQFHPQQLILFGSQARNTMDDRSDLDLLAVVAHQGHYRQLALAMDRALRGLRLARDIVVLSPEEFERDRGIPGTLARAAQLEGKVLYDSTS